MTTSRSILRVAACGAGSRTATAAASSPQRWTATRPARDGWLDVTHQLLGDGIFGGDHHRMRVSLEAGTKAVLRSVTATSLRGGPESSFAARVTVRAGASFFYLPGALIPHAGSTHVSSLNIVADGSARVLAAAVVTPGRTGMGERAQFDALRMRTRVTHGGELLLAEDATFEPESAPFDSEAVFAGAGAVVSVIAAGPWCASAVEWWANLFSDVGVAGYAGPLRLGQGVRAAAICGSLGAALAVMEEIERRVRGEL